MAEPQQDQIKRDSRLLTAKSAFAVSTRYIASYEEEYARMMMAIIGAKIAAGSTYTWALDFVLFPPKNWKDVLGFTYDIAVATLGTPDEDKLKIRAAERVFTRLEGLASALRNSTLTQKWPKDQPVVSRRARGHRLNRSRGK